MKGYAAVSRTGVERGGDVGGLQSFEDALDERPVDSAHEFSLFLGELVEWTVGKPDFAIGGEWLVSAFRQHVAWCAAVFSSAGGDAGCVGRPFGFTSFAAFERRGE